MNALCLLLASWEIALWRMTSGIFHFVFHGFPEWIIRTLLYTIGPAIVRAIRVGVALCIWLGVLFGPAASAVVFGAPFWVGVGAAVWVLIAIAGSIYGLYRVVKKRRAAAKAAVPVAAVPITSVPPSKPPVARLLPPTRPAAHCHKV
jgi:hypothetical protein